VPATEKITICYSLLVHRIGKATAAHIHEGKTGTNGPIRVTLDPPKPLRGGGGNQPAVRGDAAIQSLSERSETFNELRLRDPIYEYAPRPTSMASENSLEQPKKTTSPYETREPIAPPTIEAASNPVAQMAMVLTSGPHARRSNRSLVSEALCLYRPTDPSR
jgi:hypothetical protein